MVNYEKYVKYCMDKKPESCEECPAFKTRECSAHNDRWTEDYCELGYFNDAVVRPGKRHPNCQMDNDERVAIMPTAFRRETNKTYNFDFTLNIWVQNVNIEAKNPEQAKEKLLDMSIDEILDEAYLKDYNITDINRKTTKYAFNSVYDFIFTSSI